MMEQATQVIWRLILTQVILPFFWKMAKLNRRRFEIPHVFRVNRDTFSLLSRRWYFSPFELPHDQLWLPAFVQNATLHENSHVWKVDRDVTPSLIISSPNKLRGLTMSLFHLTQIPDLWEKPPFPSVLVTNLSVFSHQKVELFRVSRNHLPSAGVKRLSFCAAGPLCPVELDLTRCQFSRLTRLNIKVNPHHLSSIAPKLCHLTHLVVVFKFPDDVVQSDWEEDFRVQWPPHLRHLIIKQDVYHIFQTCLDELPDTLTHLEIKTDSSLSRSLDHLPAGLELLHLCHCDVTSLDHLPQSLKDLSIETFDHSVPLDHLPLSLEKLSIPSNYPLSLDHLPPQLRRLSFFSSYLIPRVTGWDWLPENLETFHFHNQVMFQASAPALPLQLEHLPSRLRHLTLSLNHSLSLFSSLHHLPTSQLSTLKLIKLKNLSSFPHLPQLSELQLLECEFSGHETNHQIRLPFFPRLLGLDLKNCRGLEADFSCQMSLCELIFVSPDQDIPPQGLPPHLNSLQIKMAFATPLPRLPVTLQSLGIYNGHSHEKRNFNFPLSDLRDLVDLRELVIHSSTFNQSLWLPPSLLFLEVCRGAIARIENPCLPCTLHQLHLCHPQSQIMVKNPSLDLHHHPHWPHTYCVAHNLISVLAPLQFFFH